MHLLLPIDIATITCWSNPIQPILAYSSRIKHFWFDYAKSTAIEIDLNVTYTLKMYPICYRFKRIVPIYSNTTIDDYYVQVEHRKGINIHIMYSWHTYLNTRGSIRNCVSMIFVRTVRENKCISTSILNVYTGCSLNFTRKIECYLVALNLAKI